MKTIFRIATTHFWLLAFVALANLTAQDAYAMAVLAQQVQGDVQIHKTTDAPDAWTAVTQDTALATGDSVKTLEGSCVLVYGDQATFSLEKNTTLTLEETASSQALKLLLGKIKGKVNHQNAAQPFEVITPAAVATVRGTEVDFGFNDEGQLTVDLHNGKIEVVNDDAELNLSLDGKKSIKIQYDKESNMIRIKNECGSDGAVTFNVLGTEYSESPCGEKEVNLSTAEKGTGTPATGTDQSDPENLDEGRRVTDMIN